MEQHPVPQNVTSFQFRLIGDMTLKQFGYLAGGLISAYISYKLPLPFFFTYPLALFCGLTGIGFAFVPIEERPMDVWVMSFIKSIYSPTQYIWQKTPSTPMQHGLSVPKKNIPPAHTMQTAPIMKSAGSPAPVRSTTASVKQLFAVEPPLKPQAQLSQKRQNMLSGVREIKPKKKTGGFFELLSTLFHTKPRADVSASAPANHHDSLFASQTVPSVTGRRFDHNAQNAIQQNAGESVAAQNPPAAQPQQPASVVSRSESESEKRSRVLEAQIRVLEDELRKKTLTEARILELQKQVTDELMQKRMLENQLAELRRQIPPRQSIQTPFMRSAGVVPMQKPPGDPTVRVFAADNLTRAGIPRLTSVPNIITGVIKDSDGNFLPGVLVTVRDANDVPLRALKTNKLGQFAASTPLPQGTYLIETEDPRERFIFDRAQVALTDTVIPPIEIIAKSQKEVSRQKLAQELFGGQNI